MREIIDNALSIENFNTIKRIVEDENLNWFYIKTVAHCTESDANHGGYLVHNLYKNNYVVSNNYEDVFNAIVDSLPKYRTLIRMRFIMYPRSLNILEHDSHRDYEFENNGFLLYINTNDGFTRLKDGTKVNSVENRALLHEASEEHNSSTCTDAPFRICLVLNYL
jgi:hypothetical protein